MQALVRIVHTGNRAIKPRIITTLLSYLIRIKILAKVTLGVVKFNIHKLIHIGIDKYILYPVGPGEVIYLHLSQKRSQFLVYLLIFISHGYRRLVETVMRVFNCLQDRP